MEVHREGPIVRAVVMRGFEVKCRLSIAAPDLSDEDARTELADKAREWIADYLARSAA